MHKRLLGLHIRDTSNIGDRYCHPLDYFDFHGVGGVEVLIGDVRHPPTDLEPDYVLLGGGAIARYAPDLLKRYPNARFMAWGVGFTQPKLEPVTSDATAWFSKDFELWGSRDYDSSSRYVPCVSCIHHLFDQVPEPTHDVVVYGHARRRPLDQEAAELGLPYMANHDKGSFESAIAHLASGRTVIASSFHGAYWATLLGRRVAMIPFGSKFYSLKHRPPPVETVAEGIYAAVDFPQALADSRDISRSFALSVEEILAKGGASDPTKHLVETAAGPGPWKGPAVPVPA